jgi:hypothetical protein
MRENYNVPSYKLKQLFKMDVTMLLSLWCANIFHEMPYFCVSRGFWNHEFTCMCVCVKQFIVNCNYDYNINSHIEKLTHNSLTF